jgi:hypothetical protein
VLVPASFAAPPPPARSMVIVLTAPMRAASRSTVAPFS